MKIFTLQNAKGQMAIFIALIFQVLFILFAMVLNIGLNIHNKINLQNSLDLAVYYGAQRQAELLNLIAHQNYQIKRAWKLMAWRQFVLGTAAVRQGPGDSLSAHPAAVGNGGFCSKWESANSSFLGGHDHPGDVCIAVPVACVFSNFPFVTNDAHTTSSFCNNVQSFTISKFKVPNVGPGGELSGLPKSIQGINELVQEACGSADYQNWLFAASNLFAFDIETHYRLRLLYKAASRLVQFKDIDNQSIHKGMEQVFLKNLTYQNKKAYTEGQGNIAFFNSLKSITDLYQLFSPIRVLPLLPFITLDAGSGCNKSGEPDFVGFLLQHNPLPENKRMHSMAEGEVAKRLTHTFDRLLQTGSRVTSGDFPPSFPEFYAVGVEKNPFHMVYVGGKAQVQPHSLFSVGEPTPMGARAFAKPFGGRIGPWYCKTWKGGDDGSGDGSACPVGERVDPNLSFRIGVLREIDEEILEEIRGTNGLSKVVPNYAFYPGDSLGLKSWEALSQVQIGNKSGSTNDGFELRDLHQMGFLSNVNFKTWTGLSHEFKPSPGSANSIASRRLRDYERLALLPNHFDNAYYSIFPYGTMSLMHRWEKSTKGVGGDLENKLFPENEGAGLTWYHQDIGACNLSSEGESTCPFPNLYNLARGIAAQNSGGTVDSFSNLLLSNNINDMGGLSQSNNKWSAVGLEELWPKLLTAWVPSGGFEYFPPQSSENIFFQKCETGKGLDSNPGTRVAIPGGCVGGGRVGYSVKLVAEEALLEGGWQFVEGGEQSIKNPPQGF